MEQLINKMFGGSSELFFSAFLKNSGISEQEAQRIAKIIQEAKGDVLFTFGYTNEIAQGTGFASEVSVNWME